MSRPGPKSLERDDAELALLIHTCDECGVLHQLTEVISAHGANITYVDITNRHDGLCDVYFELQSVVSASALIDALRKLEVVTEIEQTDAFSSIFGKRIIVIGGGAQVGHVAVGAISEADRHNIRGERISVDTIALVGEANIAGAVRAVADLPRARCLVLAGSIMGGDISRAADELRAVGIPIIALNMVGSITDHVDLVVTDPVQAGTMAVMAIADTATFDLARQRGRRY